MATIKSELALVKKLNGIAILGAAGKVLGVTGVVTSSIALYNDIQDGNGVSLVNVADVAISVGTLFIKSNVVGLAVSGGWLLIKGEFGE